jgi:hypothetical protein
VRLLQQFGISIGDNQARFKDYFNKIGNVRNDSPKRTTMNISELWGFRTTSRALQRAGYGEACDMLRRMRSLKQVSSRNHLSRPDKAYKIDLNVRQ